MEARNGNHPVSECGSYIGYWYKGDERAHQSKNLVLKRQITAIATQYQHTQHKCPNNKKRDDPALITG
jgi:hypothetical protein